MGKWDLLLERELGRTKGIVGEGEGETSQGGRGKDVI